MSGSGKARGQSGAVLPLVLAATLIGGLIVAALVSFAYTNIASTRAYRARTDGVDRAGDATSLAIAAMRSDLSRGVEGNTYTLTYDGFTVSCAGLPGSGLASSGSVADRRVLCSASVGANALVRTRVRFVDEGGNDPGAEVEIIDREISG